MKLNLTYLFLAALLLGGCAKDTLVENPTKGETVPLQLSATSVGSVDILPSTKADPVEDLKVATGIYLAGKDVTASFFSSNIQYVPGALSALTPFTGVSPISLTLGENYDIYAYAPFKTGVTTVTAIPVTSADDVMWATKNTLLNVTTATNKAALAYSRRAAQVKLNVVFDSSFPAEKKVFNVTSASKIEVTGFYSTEDGKLNLLTGELTPDGNPTATKSALAADGALKFPQTQFLLPTTGGLKLSIVVTHFGKQYKGELSTLAGKSYDYTIKVSSTSTDLGVTGTVVAWIPATGEVTVSE